MHIVILTQYYPPELGAPQARLSDLANRFAKHGDTVDVITAYPSYPTGKLLTSQRGLYYKDVSPHITVHHLRAYVTQSPRMLHRLLSYFSFVCASLVFGMIRIHKADYLITESPPLFLGITGYLLSKRLRAKWIFNVSDLWPASVQEIGGSSGFLIRMAEQLEYFCYRNAYVVTGQSETIINNIQTRYPKTKTYHLSNGVDVTPFMHEFKKNPNHEFRIIYTGLHGLAQGLDIVVEAARQLTGKQIIFILVGDGPLKKKLIAQARCLPHVQFLDPVPKDSIPHVLAQADAALVPLGKQLTGAVPSKLYEMMAARLPVIAMLGAEGAQTVKNAKCGYVVSPGDINGLSDAIVRITNCTQQQRDIMGNNGYNHVNKYFNRANIFTSFHKHLTKEHTA